MRSLFSMLKDLTVRPKERRTRATPPLPAEEDWSKPLSAQKVRSLLNKSSDIIFREFTLRGKEEVTCLLVYVDGLTDKYIIDHYLLKILMVDFNGEPQLSRVTADNALDTVFKFLAPASEAKKIKELGEALDSILGGDAVLFFGEYPQAMVIGVRNWPNRGVWEPETEAVVRGPREGFTETLRTNTTLLRRKIKHPAFRLISLKIGELTRTDVVVAYIETLAKPDVVSEVLKRLSRIKVDGVLESAYIEEMIEDYPYSPFPQIAYTERPDVLAADLLEGKVGIIVDGTPIALTVPVVLAQFLQVSEDYYERAMIVILIRFIRYLGVAVALLAPSIYIAVTTFHQEILPSNLALSIAAGREGVPFSALSEAMMMTLALEILMEAGLRLPKPIGQTIGIVGALVLGDAAVKASLVSPLMVIIIGLTAISGYAIPSYDLGIAVRLIRLPMMILAGTMGFFGLGLGVYALLIHLLSLRSFGYPYMSPLAPLRLRALLQDTFVRTPRWGLKHRPHLLDADTDRKKPGGKR
ncbi:Bacillus/Clostridium Ger spore germination protein [Acididesulfobacillus acetoxydans]|uniref:Bacillus/Clostridium Ger spore germination protein n=1 Tax=Acididesulfobacillus acetoxydans TaxID=1561005 RepID=A0A8S0WVT7_9FIRM|nr:spore germination protein [Acididesulfobacillus acetoxydans]CAA7599861.1 Bacillus/Clostridium Ger spore germination protein [Acididesulfobacillus acetoxydans]CEJ07427.1 Spore germination protein KA [Acididesulfobacillus acetoxydans]